MKEAMIQPYLFFNGQCAEAVEFYRSALGAQVVMMMRYKESPEPPPPGMVPPGWDEKIMHCAFTIGTSTIMASDGCSLESGFDGFSLSVYLETESEARRVFDALSKEGKVNMPLGRTFWSPCFGMVTDRFGIGWMVTIHHSQG